VSCDCVFLVVVVSMWIVFPQSSVPTHVIFKPTLGVGNRPPVLTFTSAIAYFLFSSFSPFAPEPPTYAGVEELPFLIHTSLLYFINVYVCPLSYWLQKRRAFLVLVNLVMI
jgi:hypothetical protein